jgi:hypothetical protein
MNTNYVAESIAAANTFSASIALSRKFNFSLSGIWAATVAVQRSFDGGITWLDVATFTANGEYVGEEPEPGVTYRFGVKTGEYTSGTIVGRLSQ